MGTDIIVFPSQPLDQHSGFEQRIDYFSRKQLSIHKVLNKMRVVGNNQNLVNTSMQSTGMYCDDRQLGFMFYSSFKYPLSKKIGNTNRQRSMEIRR